MIGKSNLYSRSNIASLTSPSPTLRSKPNPPTGLAGFASFLAEDNMIGLAVWHQLHLRHTMTSDVALDFLGALTLRDYVNRRIRWIRVRKKMTPIIATAIEPFTESIVAGIYGSWAIGRLFGATVPVFWLLHMVLWLAVDLSVRDAVRTNVRRIGPQTSSWEFMLAWGMREVMALPIYLYGIIGDEVTWRGKRYRMVALGKCRLHCLSFRSIQPGSGPRRVDDNIDGGVLT